MSIYANSAEHKLMIAIEEYSAKRGLSHQIMKIELVSISATESSLLYIL